MKKYEGIKSIEGYWDDECFPAVKGKHVDVNDCVIFTSDESPAEIFREVNSCRSTFDPIYGIIVYQLRRRHGTNSPPLDCLHRSSDCSGTHKLLLRCSLQRHLW